MTTNQENFDAIVIGSGISGLTCASLLSRIARKRILLLERHFKPGGFTHTFKRDAGTRFEWDVGLHYVGRMGPGSDLKAICDFITSGGVSWQALPHIYDVFVYPKTVFRVQRGSTNFKNDLIAAFPDEQKAIVQYFKDLKKVTGWMSRRMVASMLPLPGKVISRPGTHFALQSTAEYLQQRFQNKDLKAVIASQWGNYGLPPQQSAFVIHALIVQHYMDGGFYPVGGSKTIADNILRGIENNGGQLLLNHQVERLKQRGSMINGVLVKYHKKSGSEQKTFNAPLVISCAGAHTTYGDLLGGMYSDKFKYLQKGTAHVSLYAGLTQNPKSLGLQGENYWIFDSDDHDEMFSRRNELIDGRASHCFVSFPSLKNPEAQSHTMQVISFIDMDPFLPWADKPWKKRGDDYERIKQQIVETLLDFVEHRIRGIRNLVDYTELSTPLSTYFFTGHHDGAIYGIPATPSRYRQNWLGIRTPFSNLYLTGSDTTSHGFAGAMWSGVLTAATIMGMPWSLFKIMRSCRQ